MQNIEDAIVFTVILTLLGPKNGQNVMQNFATLILRNQLWKPEFCFAKFCEIVATLGTNVVWSESLKTTFGMKISLKNKLRRAFEVTASERHFALRNAVWGVPWMGLVAWKLSDRSKIAVLTFLEVTNATKIISTMYWGCILIVWSKNT